jgi:hypothetical protein
VTSWESAGVVTGYRFSEMETRSMDRSAFKMGSYGAGIVLRGGKPYRRSARRAATTRTRPFCRLFSTSLNSGPAGIRTCTKRSNGRASRGCTSKVPSGRTIRVSTGSKSRQTSLTPSATYDEGRVPTKEGLAVRTIAMRRARLSRALSSQVGDGLNAKNTLRPMDVFACGETAEGIGV